MIKRSEYEELKLISWWVAVDEISEEEAHAIYKRNWRYVSQDHLQPHEKALIARLTSTYGDGVPLSTDTVRIFLDTEFSDFTDLHLISIGMVSDDGRTFYQELPVEFPVADFVRETVMPLLGKVQQCPRSELAERIREYLAQFGIETRIHLCCDAFEDYTLFAEALNGKLPDNVVYIPLRDRIDAEKQEQFWFKTKLPRHHALNDAMANRAAFIAIAVD